MKILLLTYYFPPCGGAAVQRWLRFIKALHARGESVTVITTQDGDYPYRDESLVANLPQGLRVLRSKPLGFGWLWKALGQKALPYGSLQNQQGDPFLKRALYWLRLNLVVPDLRMGWNKGAYCLAEQELKRDKYSYVITTGPPHSTHLIGLKLKRHFMIEWRTDFRDPFSDIYYLKLNPPSRLTMQAHKYLERRIIANADLNYIVSKSIAEALPPGRKTVLYNGFDPEDFKDLAYARSEHYRIKFVGQLTAGQDITPLLTALDELVNKSDKSVNQEIDTPKIEFSIIGTRDFPKTDLPLKKVDFLPHRQALAELVQAELLVMIINSYKGNKGMLTTKLFEYIASRTPVLCLAELGGEAGEIINQTGCGVVLQSSESIKAYISESYDAWKAGKAIRCTGEIASFDVNNQVSVLIDL